MAASDESFGEKENLLRPEAGVFDPGRYGHRGEIVDGWETKRRREPGNDWALIRLGAAGVISSIDVDTSHFTGNFPESCRVEACGVEGYPGPAELAEAGSEWIELVPRSVLQGNAHNSFPVSDSRRFTHVRLSTYPDGGLARLRVLGYAVPDPRLLDGLTVDLAGQLYGGAVVASSDAFYTSAQLLNRPDRARTMGEGWETRRRRDAGHDMVVIQLGFVGLLRQLVVDTAHYKYNASAEISVDGCEDETAPAIDATGWQELLPRTRLEPDTEHVFPIGNSAPVGSIRLHAYPDGGLSRVRVIGSVEASARRRAGYQWFNSLPGQQAMAVLLAAGLAADGARALAARRPLEQGQAALPAKVAAMLEGSR
jgi:allantoicase